MTADEILAELDRLHAKLKGTEVGSVAQAIAMSAFHDACEEHWPTLAALVRRQREALKAVEWAAGPRAGIPCCPACVGNQHIGHVPDCPLAAALR